MEGEKSIQSTTFLIWIQCTSESGSESELSLCVCLGGGLTQREGRAEPQMKTQPDVTAHAAFWPNPKTSVVSGKR